MRILHIAPFNTAGVPYSFVQAGKSLGHDSVLLTFARHPFNYPEDICLSMPFLKTPGLPFLKKFIRLSDTCSETDFNLPRFKKISKLESYFLRFRELFWRNKIDQIDRHVNFRDFDLIQLDGGAGFYHDLRLIKSLSESGIPVIAVYYGSDLRTRGVIEQVHNISICNFSVEWDHIDLYPGIIHIPFPFDFTNFDYRHYKLNKIPVIGHAPSNRQEKGTDHILESLNLLKKDYSFEIMLIENIPHSEALELKTKCDIFIDQISDLGYGINALESLAMGIPTFSSLMPEFKLKYPESPIVEIKQGEINEKLIPFLESKQLREKHGIISYGWVRDVHDANDIVKRMHSKISNSINDH